MKKLMAIGSILLLAGSMFYMIFANPHVPLLDANRTVLAETHIQGYCAGKTFMQSRGTGDRETAADCRSQYEDMEDPIEHRVVQYAFCLGIVDAGWGGTAGQCHEIAASNRIWPTMDGGITSDWNRKFPYPLEQTIEDVDNRSNSSRTGDREDNNREGEVPYRP